MDRLSVRRFQYLDLAFGMTDGYENVHYLLKDACCAQRAPTRWAAVLVLAEFPDFAPDARRVQFTAETIGRWVFEEYAVLRPLAEAADLLLSEYTDWPMLSNPVRRAENQVPIAAAAYLHDPYVPVVHSLETANKIPGLTAWVSSEYEHDALRLAGADVFDTLEQAASAESTEPNHHLPRIHGDSGRYRQREAR